MKSETIGIPIFDTIAPYLDHSVKRNEFVEIETNSPITKDDLKIARKYLPQGQRRISSENLYIKKKVYMHTPTNTLVESLDYEPLPRINTMAFHEPHYSIPRNAPRQAKVALAKAILDAIDVDLCERVDGAIAGKYTYNELLRHIKDACKTMETIYGDLLNKKIAINDVQYLAKLLRKMIRYVPKASAEVRNELLERYVDAEDLPSPPKKENPIEVQGEMA